MTMERPEGMNLTYADFCEQFCTCFVYPNRFSQEDLTDFYQEYLAAQQAMSQENYRVLGYNTVAAWTRVHFGGFTMATHGNFLKS